jgi:hypothetical protein
MYFELKALIMFVTLCLEEGANLKKLNRGKKQLLFKYRSVVFRVVLDSSNFL